MRSSRKKHSVFSFININECNYIIFILNISIGTDLENLVTKQYTFGDTVTIAPYTVHKMEAVEDCLYTETSTNELWDVIRLQDSYGRCL